MSPIEPSKTGLFFAGQFILIQKVISTKSFPASKMAIALSKWISKITFKLSVDVFPQVSHKILGGD